MRSVLAAIGALLVLNVFIILGTASGTARLWPLVQELLVSLGIALAVFLAAWRLTRSAVSPKALGSAYRVVIVMLIAAITEALVVTVTPRSLGVIGEILYYIALFFAGVGLAAWARSGEVTPIWTAMLLLLLPAIAGALRFGSNADARFQYGPEVHLFMLWGYAGHINMLPLDAVVAWAGWRTWAAYGGRLSGITSG